MSILSRVLERMSILSRVLERWIRPPVEVLAKVQPYTLHARLNTDGQVDVWATMSEMPTDEQRKEIYREMSRFLDELKARGEREVQ